MHEKFKIRVNENSIFELTGEDVEKVDALKIKGNTYHILQDHRPFQVELTNTDFNRKEYHVKVNNNNYTVAIADSLDLLIDEMGFAMGTTKNIGSVSAPMPGLILEISVKEGQEVKEDDQLLILEAMKMENVITSPRDGVIKKVAVKQGEAVEKKRLLIEFE